MAGLKDKRGFIDKDRLDLSERKAVKFSMKHRSVRQGQLTTAHLMVGRMTRDPTADLSKKSQMCAATNLILGNVPDAVAASLLRSVRLVGKIDLIRQFLSFFKLMGG